MFLLDEVPSIDQYKEGLPTGCEATAAAQALQYLGVKVSAMQVVQMLKREPFMFSFGNTIGNDENKLNRFGGNPNRAFVGDPLSASVGMG